MNIQRIQTLSFLVLVAVLITSFYVANPDTTQTTIVRTFPETKLVQENILWILERVNPPPIKLNYTYKSNTTISLYVQTRSQFEGSSENSKPEEYLAMFSGDKGSLVYEVKDQSKRHVISVYGDERYLVDEIILESEYHSVVKGTRTMTSLVLQLLIFVALGIQAYALTLKK